MTIKTTGAEFKAFYADESVWKNAYHEDTVIIVDGVDETDNADLDLCAVPDSSVMSISGGVILFEDSDKSKPFEAEFIKWRKLQRTVFVSGRVPRENAATVEAAILAAGGKLVR